MTHVTIFRSCSGDITGFESTGHADYAEIGTDIVCAAISAILQTAMLGIRDVLCLDIGLSMDDGEMTLILDRGVDSAFQAKANIVFETMLAGLKSIQAAYSEYLTILERRCR